MLDFVPLAGPRWRMTTLIASPVSSASFWSSIFHSRKREPLLPPPSAVIDTTLGAGVAWLPQQLPPTSNTCDGKGGCVVIDPYIDPAQIVGDIIHAVRGRLYRVPGLQSHVPAPFRVRLADTVLGHHS